MTPYHFSFPTNIYFGIGSRFQLSKELKVHRICRPLIVTDPGIIHLEFLKEIQTHLLEAKLELKTFSGITSNPVKSQITAGVKAFQEHRADSIIGIGGGAAL